MSDLRVGNIVLRVDDIDAEAAFWSAALDLEVHRPDDDYAILKPRNGDGPNIALDRVPAPVQVPPKIHLDLYTRDQTGEVERLVGLGATEIHWSKRPPDADYRILADPEGNRFCVIDTTR